MINESTTRGYSNSRLKLIVIYHNEINQKLVADKKKSTERPDFPVALNLPGESCLELQ